MTTHEILKTYWNYDAFRPMQEDIIQSALDGKDTLALLPTGGGKSICFQVPALALEGICLVISPLIALMKDQVEHLQQKNIKAKAIYSGMSRSEVELILNQAVNNIIKFLYVSPERLESDIFMGHFKQMKIGLIAVDEAHCISQWGYDFRPPYLKIAQIREYHPKTPILALTATATPEVVEDIQEKLAFAGKNVFQKSFERSNLAYLVFKEADKYGRLLRIFTRIQGCGLVYVRNRKRTREIALFLQKNGISADFYHAGLESKDRDIKQQAWMNGKIRIMVATNAFGMGIDKPDVRVVVHLDLPDSPEAYFQEAGRAGRDLQQSFATLLYDGSDITSLQRNFDTSFPEISFIKTVYEALGNYFQIPVGSGKDASFDFELPHFCEHYGLPVTAVFHAIHFLERGGYVQLQDSEETVSKVYIASTKDILYQAMVLNSEDDKLIKTLLRSYGGLFTDFTRINEQELAKRSNLNIKKVVQILTTLDKQHVLDYIPRKEKPQLIFLQERISGKDIALSKENYKQLKEAAAKRIQAMIAYVQKSDCCRSLSLLAYFGEQSQYVCGKCDVCIAQRKDKKQQEMEDRIKDLLQHKPLQIQEVVVALTIFEEVKIVELIRLMLDHGELKYNKDRCLILN